MGGKRHIRQNIVIVALIDEDGRCVVIVILRQFVDSGWTTGPLLRRRGTSGGGSILDPHKEIACCGDVFVSTAAMAAPPLCGGERTLLSWVLLWTLQRNFWSRHQGRWQT